ncbi:alpha-hydroxy-acid oxidizing protein [Geminicoccus flavidas]|uniref:alpha-hydroxy-acid oxidizing protein n=1 Tax=Geminicoccus flavidas TaxID=2506407 RepID=UPI00135AEE42|nr:alpha-hydroxy-acid oxidizing protein [Geminicoccus flavidas]
MTSVGRRRQTDIFMAGLARRRPVVPVCPRRLEQAALARLGGDAAAYIAGGAGFERTMAANRAAFDRWAIVQRVLRDVSKRDLSVELFGRSLPLPFLLGPIGVLDMAHRQADLAAARAARAEGIPFVTSTQSSFSMEEIAQAGGDGPRWFQLYWSARDELTESFVRRAELAGYEALVVTLDTTELSWRPRDLDRGYLPFLRGRGIANYVSDPVFGGLRCAGEGNAASLPVHPMIVWSVLEFLRAWPGGMLDGLRRSKEAMAAIQRFVAVYARPSLTWGDLPFLRARTRLPILLKGVLHPDDARRALDAGVDGIIVSNHGGRQLDGAIGALHALPAIVDVVAERLPVLFDSGIRTGSDIIKAIALGARAVLIGRPYVYGLALKGEAGVRAVISDLAADLDLTLGLSGFCRLRDLNRSALTDCHPDRQQRAGQAEHGRPEG